MSTGLDEAGLAADIFRGAEVDSIQEPDMTYLACWRVYNLLLYSRKDVCKKNSACVGNGEEAF